MNRKAACICAVEIASRTRPVRGMVGGVSEMDSMRDWLGEMFGQIGERFDRVDQRLDGVDQRLDRFETRVDERFNQVDERFDRLEARVEEIAAVNGTLIDEVARINQRLS